VIYSTKRQEWEKAFIQGAEEARITAYRVRFHN
jgi:hypothetical protein